MGLLDSIKSKISRERNDSSESLIEEASEPVNLPDVPEFESSSPEPPQADVMSMPQPQVSPMPQQPAQYPAYSQPLQQPIQQPPNYDKISNQLEIINSKIDTLKAQLENLNNSLRIINAKLR